METTGQCNNLTVHPHLGECAVQSAGTGGVIGQQVHNPVKEQRLEIQ